MLAERGQVGVVVDAHRDAERGGDLVSGHAVPAGEDRRRRHRVRAPAILARYPWNSYSTPYTAAYMIGDIWTDSGFLTGIGGCPTQNLAAQFASTTRTYFYQFDDRHAPGLNNDHPGYQWGAGHAMELAYLWPSFNKRHAPGIGVIVVIGGLVLVRSLRLICHLHRSRKER